MKLFSQAAVTLITISVIIIPKCFIISFKFPGSLAEVSDGAESGSASVNLLDLNDNRNGNDSDSNDKGSGNTELDGGDETNEGGEQESVNEPVFENGLLVLNHENIIETIDNRNNNKNATLLLIAFYEPWCTHSQHMIHILENVAQITQHTFYNHMDGHDLHQDNYHDHDELRLSSLSPPLFAKMDTSHFDNEDVLQFLTFLGDDMSMDYEFSFPMLKFVFIQHNNNHSHNDSLHNQNEAMIKEEGDIRKDKQEEQVHRNINSNTTYDSNDNHDGVDMERTIIDFTGRSDTTQDIVDTVMHYWYRFVASYYMNINDRIKPNILTFPNFDSFISFVQKHKHYLFKEAKQELTSASATEESYIRYLLEANGDSHNDNSEINVDVQPDQTDPFFAFVQCIQRQHVYSQDDIFVSSHHHDHAHEFIHEFEEIAKTYVYRRDVIFVHIKSCNCEEWTQLSYHNNERFDDGDYHTGVIKFYVSISTKEQEKIDWTFGNSYPHEKSTLKTPALSLTQFVIIETTPTILWFDRLSSASLAFPIYRQIHVVLFIDMHTSRLKDGTFQYSSLSSQQSKDAISKLRNTAKRHHQKRPNEDVVFLVVPSTETKVLTSFGIDVWSEMDKACNKENLKECFPTNIPSLPMVMITSRRENPYVTRRYYLHSDKLMNHTSNALDDFLSDYFLGNLVHHIKSEPIPLQSVLSSGVQVLTGDTFNDLVMNEKNKHSLVIFYAPYCGHCKRFKVIWNELAKVIKQFNWEDIVDVNQLDVTKNHIEHEMVDINEIPAVYLFPKGHKESPIEMSLEIGTISDVYPILDWMLECNVFDDEELYNLILGSK